MRLLFEPGRSTSLSLRSLHIAEHFWGRCVDRCESVCNVRNFRAVSKTLHVGMSDFVQSATSSQDSRLKIRFFFALPLMFGPHWQTTEASAKHGCTAKNAKIPRTTAWRSKTVEKGNLGKCSTFDSSTRMSIDPEESAQSSSHVFENDSMLTFLNETDLQSDQSSTQPPTSTTESGDSDPAYLEVEVDEFSSFFVDPENNSVACSSEESSESDTESSDCSSDSEFDGEQDET